jgi:hypothetical protein
VPAEGGSIAPTGWPKKKNCLKGKPQRRQRHYYVGSLKETREPGGVAARQTVEKGAFTALPVCDKLLRAENTILNNVTGDCASRDASIQGILNNA